MLRELGASDNANNEFGWAERSAGNKPGTNATGAPASAAVGAAPKAAVAAAPGGQSLFSMLQTSSQDWDEVLGRSAPDSLTEGVKAAKNIKLRAVRQE